MEFFVIAEREIVLGFNLAGVKGRAVSDRQEALDAFYEVTNQKVDGRSSGVITEKVKILIVTEDVADMLGSVFEEWQMKGVAPVAVEIPGLHGHNPHRKSLTQAISDAVGIKV